MTTEPITASLAEAIRSASSVPASTTDKAPLKAGYSAPKSRRVLTGKQKTCLLVMARDAWHIHGEPDNIPFDAWRHAECLAACGVGGLTKARNHHFRALKSHFLALQGKDEASLATALSTGPDITPGETVEDAEQARWLLRKALSERGLGEPWCLSVTRQRFHIGSIDRLSAAQAMAILFEVRRLYTPVPAGSPPVRATKGQRSHGGSHSPRPNWRD